LRYDIDMYQQSKRHYRLFGSCDKIA